MSNDKPKCAKRVYGSMWRDHPCKRAAMEGSKYCFQHTPEAREARAEAAEKRFVERLAKDPARMAFERAAALEVENKFLRNVMSTVGHLLVNAIYNRFGKPEWSGVCTLEREQVRKLALKYRCPPSAYTMEQAGKVLVALSAAKEPE